MEFDEDGLVMKDMVMREALPTCEQPYCGGLVKPDIVFFGEAVRSRLSYSFFPRLIMCLAPR